MRASLFRSQIVPSKVRHVRVFVSSPGDLPRERALARAVVEKLGKDAVFRNHLKLDPILWDDPEAPAPMLADLTPQESVNQGLVRPGDCDMVVVIFWSRMGTPLRETNKPDGSPYLSGTEWEYEDALHGGREVLLYRRTEEVVVGVDDPDLDAKRDQKRRVDQFFHGLDGAYRSYRKPQEFAVLLEANLRSLLVRYLERWQPIPPEETLFPNARPSLASASAFHPRSPEIPPRTRCFGRKRELSRLARCVLRTPRKPIGILGGPGMGKTTISLALRDDPEVLRRFGTDIYFVRCDAVGSAEILAQTLCRELGVELGETDSARDVFVRELRNDPTLLIIDNLETPWEQDRDNVQELLRALAEISTVSLVVTMRGNEPPSSESWERSIFATPLGMQAARQLFLDEAQNEAFARDGLLPTLLTELDGVPLAVRLLANNTHGEPSLKTVMARWKSDRIRMLRRSVVASHRDSLEASLELSLTSRRMSDAGRRLLSILALLPEGADHRDLEGLLPEEGLGAAAVLRRLALALDERERISLLSPVREFVSRRLPCEEVDTRSTMAFYRQLLIRYSVNASPEGAAVCIERLQPELRNIEASIEHALRHDKDEALAAAIAFAHVMRYTGLGTTSFLEKVLNATAGN